MEIACTEVFHGSEAYWQTVALRHEILRKPLSMQFSPEELAAENDSYHLGAYVAGELVASMILKPISSQIVKMRQVVTAEKYQGKGIGRTLVAYVEQFAWAKGYETISLHARLGAVPFYQKLSYDIVGGVFEEVGMPHYKMVKEKIVNP